jgi:hypothetical protein
MNTAIATDSSIWEITRRLYPLYCALARQFTIEVLPCRDLDESLDAPPAVALTAANEWLAEMDKRIQIHHLRQFAQTSAQMNEESLRDLLLHHLNKKTRGDDDRDKVDFLLVQFFSQRASSELNGPGVSLVETAKVLEPILGPIEIAAPEWLEPLEELLGTSFRAKNLNELFTLRVIEQGRQIKSSCGEKFFEPRAMVAFARFGFLVRRAFFRLMHQDLNAILDGLRELEAAGVTTLDCRKAQFAADEPIARLRMICQSWKVMFHAEYSSGQPLCILVDLRTAVESALAHRARLSGSNMKVNGAAAGSSSAQEFEITEPEPWSGETGE